MLFLLPYSMFSTSIGGKYATPDFVKCISLEINYLVGTGCFFFVFKKYKHKYKYASLLGNKI